MYETDEWVDAGGLMSYGASDPEKLPTRCAIRGQDLEGTNPAHLPVEQPTKFEFVINLKTAKVLNFEIAQSVLYRADRVIR
jgi:putative ABC transport system substrate-binding protein